MAGFLNRDDTIIGVRLSVSVSLNPSIRDAFASKVRDIKLFSIPLFTSSAFYISSSVVRRDRDFHPSPCFR